MTGLPDNLPTLQWALVTPERAGELLLRNTHNRPVPEGRLRKMVEDMKSGRWDWRSCAQVIVGTDGTLLNGQKTLMAIVRSGTAQPLILVEGVDPEAWLAMDNVQPRTLGQELRRDGVSNASECAAVAKYVWQYDHDVAIGEREAPSQTVARAMWRAERERIEPRVTEARRLSRVLGFSSGSGMAAVYVLADRVDPEGAAAFFQQIEEGAYSPGDRHPIAQLRRHVGAENRPRGRHGRHGRDNVVDVAWLILALNAFRLGDDRVISFRPDRTGRLPEPPRILSAVQVDERLGVEVESA